MVRSLQNRRAILRAVLPPSEAEDVPGERELPDAAISHFDSKAAERRAERDDGR